MIFRPSRYVPAVAWLTLTMSLTACSMFGGRSTQAFCDELEKGNRVMQTNYTSTDKEDMTGMLGAAAANIGEFTRMVHQLDEVAPAEIETDMHAVRQAWDSQADMIKESANNPFGAILGGLASSIMSAGSTKAVDMFAMEKCGSQLFGSAPKT